MARVVGKLTQRRATCRCAYHRRASCRIDERPQQSSSGLGVARPTNEHALVQRVGGVQVKIGGVASAADQMRARALVEVVVHVEQHAVTGAQSRTEEPFPSPPEEMIGAVSERSDGV